MLNILSQDFLLCVLGILVILIGCLSGDNLIPSKVLELHITLNANDYIRDHNTQLFVLLAQSDV